MSYIDGFLCPVPDARREEYRDHAAHFGAIFKEYGATQVMECWGDDVPEGKVTSFPLAVKRELGESVVFSWVAWPSKAVRDAAWEKIMADQRMPQDMSAMPFDGKRMMYGGFSPIVEL
jgi:uncharacterized protein YbaA (DUF1428 family)